MWQLLKLLDPKEPLLPKFTTDTTEVYNGTLCTHFETSEISIQYSLQRLKSTHDCIPNSHELLLFFLAQIWHSKPDRMPRIF